MKHAESSPELQGNWLQQCGSYLSARADVSAAIDSLPMSARYMTKCAPLAGVIRYAMVALTLGDSTEAMGQLQWCEVVQ